MQLTTNKKILFAATITLIISVGISQIILLMFYQPWISYNPTAVSPYDIQTKVKVTMWDSSIDWIDIPLIEFHTETDEATRIHRHVYNFQELHMGL
ncbi:MAG TPA: hypothetical protein ENI29_01480, partial [bacterium]|nr:hypothetical protein [bacterium]